MKIIRTAKTSKRWVRSFVRREQRQFEIKIGARERLRCRREARKKFYFIEEEV